MSVDWKAFLGGSVLVGAFTLVISLIMLALGNDILGVTTTLWPVYDIGFVAVLISAVYKDLKKDSLMAYGLVFFDFVAAAIAFAIIVFAISQIPAWLLIGLITGGLGLAGALLAIPFSFLFALVITLLGVPIIYIGYLIICFTKKD
jgi:hypothetical protein